MTYHQVEIIKETRKLFSSEEKKREKSVKEISIVLYWI